VKILLFSSITLLYFPSNASSSSYILPRFDTIPPPPPGDPITLTGPTSACVNDISDYFTEVPVACTCLWYIDGLIQPDTTPTFSVQWSEPGIRIVSVAFLDSGGNLSDPQSLSVTVSGTGMPGPIIGDETVCEYTFHDYYTTVGPGDSCQWTVNGVIQPGYLPSITYQFGQAGNYLFEVFAYNACGASPSQTLVVTAQGTAPSTPGPIQGPEESCKTFTDTYTTTVAAGETCEWRVNGIVQPGSATTLVVTWEEWGENLVEVRAVTACGTGNPAQKSVSVLYDPLVFLGNDTTLQQGHTIVLNAGNPGSSYLWSTGASAQTITVGVTGTYWVNVSNNCGDDSDTIVVNVLVGIEEYGDLRECHCITVKNNQVLIMQNLSDIFRIQLFTITGSVLYDGPPVPEIAVRHPGIYFLRCISKGTICNKKILISR
jgi:hypothetical protein